MNIRLDGKRAIVTGGNSGIGEAIAVCLADAGARVAINYVTHPEAAHSLVQKIQEQRGIAMAIKADVSDPEAIAIMFESIEAAWGGIDILINNAGIDGDRSFGWETDLAAWRKVIEVNLAGALYCAREALQRMVPQKSGVIINISSIHEEIARMIVVLASDTASYVTGRTIFVDGGMTEWD